MFAWTKHSHQRSIERGLSQSHIESVWTHPRAVKGAADLEKSYISAPVVVGPRRKWVTLIHNHETPPALVTVFFGVISLKRRKAAKVAALSVADLDALGS
jgi:hypothetical protein